MTTFSSFRISRFKPSSTLLSLQADSIIVKSSSVGMFVYVFEISNEASLKFWSKGIFFKSLMSWTVFFMLKAYGRGTCV